MSCSTARSMRAAAPCCASWSGPDFRVRAESGVRGAERDALIARARLVLNLHFYPTAIFELVRVSYLLANGKAVVAECGPETEIDADIRARSRARPMTGSARRRWPCWTTMARAAISRGAARRSSPGATCPTSWRARSRRRRRAAAAGHRRTADPAAAPGRAVGEARHAAAAAGPRAVPCHQRYGLGHLMRLSLVAAALGDAADVAIFTTCRVADRFWAGRLFGVDPRLDERFALEPARRSLLAFHLAVNRFAPDVVVFDTHWPYPAVGRLSERGIPSVLVMAPLAPPMMGPALRIAARDFASVLVPSVPAELESIYRGEPELLERLALPPCRLIGPVARRAKAARAATPAA